MNDFMTWATLLTYGGCVAATILVTEWLKHVVPKVDAQIISAVVALLILVIGHVATGTFAVKDILLYVVNAIAASLASNGGFDAVKSIIQQNKPPELE